MNKEKIKEIIKSKEGITLIGIIILLMVITLISISVKDTHAYYSSVTDPVQIFNSKVGDFKPKITSFYIKQSTTPKYTNLGSNTVYITPGTNNKNIDQVCITETNNINDCTNKWQNITSNNQYNYTFANTNTEGNKTIFGFVKDKYGNKSISSSDVITYDKTLPVINKFYIKNEDATKYTNLQANTVYFTYTETNPQDICVTEGTDTKNCTWVTAGSSTNYTFTNTTEGTKTVRGYVRDKAGNISSVKTSSIVYDKTAPTINKVEAGSITTTSMTLTITPNSDTSGIDKYCYSIKNSTSTNDYTCGTNNVISVSGLASGTTHTFYIYLIDKAGNGSPTNRTSYPFATKVAGKTGQDLINSRTSISTLQNTAVNGLYRYYGDYDVVTNNYICLGPSGNTCQSDADKNKYMYRIIGIADGSEKSTLDIDAGQIKVIKAISIGDKQWHSINYDTDWDNAWLQTNLNSTLFYNDTTILDTRVKSKIKSVKWYKGTITGTYRNPPTAEPTDKISSSHPIGLMYVSDYYQSWGEYSGNGNTESWLNICHGLSSGSSACGNKAEWTMTRYGYYSRDDSYLAWVVHTGGSLVAYNGSYVVTDSFAVRPVFYLQSNVALTGTGIESDPYIPS